MNFNADILRKYLNGKFSLNDKIIVDEYFENISYSSELNDTLKQFWEETSSRPNEDTQSLDAVLDKINHHILINSPKSGRIKTIWHLYSKIAAVLLVPVLLFTFYHKTYNDNVINSSWIEIHSPYGARTQFSLPDGSEGWLNSGSVIKYPAQFGSIRNVELNGEAFFNVAKNPEAPFIINANMIKIKVLGTSFNVVSYSNDSLAEVVVANGQVEVDANGHSFKEILHPSERLALNTVKATYSKSSVDVQNYTSWKSGKLIFLNDNLNEVIRKLSRFYNVDFEVKNNVNRNQLFRAVLSEESLDEILRYMKLTMDIDYTIQERKIDPNNLITKRKIIITNANKIKPM